MRTAVGSIVGMCLSVLLAAPLAQATEPPAAHSAAAGRTRDARNWRRVVRRRATIVGRTGRFYFGNRGTVAHPHYVSLVSDLPASDIEFGRRVAYPAQRDGSPGSFLRDVRNGRQLTLQYDTRIDSQRGNTGFHGYEHWKSQGRDHGSARNRHIEAYRSLLDAARFVIAHNPSVASNPRYLRHLPSPAQLQREMPGQRISGIATYQRAWDALTHAAANVRGSLE